MSFIYLNLEKVASKASRLPIFFFFNLGSALINNFFFCFHLNSKANEYKIRFWLAEIFSERKIQGENSRGFKSGYSVIRESQIPGVSNLNCKTVAVAVRRPKLKISVRSVQKSQFTVSHTASFVLLFGGHKKAIESLNLSQM